MTSGRVLTIAGVLLALATACGAFGAHALKGQLPAERLQLWDTAVRYHFFQALGLIGMGLTLRTLDSGALRVARYADNPGIGQLRTSAIKLDADTG